MKSALLVATLIGALGAGHAAAGPLTGEVVDASVRHGVGETGYVGECQTFRNLGVAIGAGIEVGVANYVSGGCSGGIAADIDGTTNILKLLPADTGFGDYRWAEIVFSGFSSTITGVTLIENNLFTLDGGGDVIPTPDISFTADSITIRFDPAGLGIFDVTPATGGFTTFQITTAAVSSPASLGLALAGLALLGLGRRKSRA